MSVFRSEKFMRIVRDMSVSMAINVVVGMVTEIDLRLS